MLPADVERLSGALHATNTALVMLMGQVAILRAEGRPDAAAEAVDEMLHALAAMIPAALAGMEDEGRPDAAAGFEDAMEGLLDLARRSLGFRAG
ncbi:MAG TPA: hypothetical protein VGN83_20930 [Falsiroseomonas sp.]|jgi:hypothetical protein|nr:hypothetical protein [Falsiroseomonas sp.]